MNCRQGDLALVVRGRDAGKMVTCLELMPSGFVMPSGLPAAKDAYPIWRVDRPVTWRRIDACTRQLIIRSEMPYAADRILLPIRPPAEDETETTEREATV